MTVTKSTSQPASSSTPDLQQSQEDEVEREEEVANQESTPGVRQRDQDESPSTGRRRKDNKPQLEHEQDSSQEDHLLLRDEEEDKEWPEEDDHLTATDSLTDKNNSSSSLKEHSRSLSLSLKSKRNDQRTRQHLKENHVKQEGNLDNKRTRERESNDKNNEDEDWSRSVSLESLEDTLQAGEILTRLTKKTNDEKAFPWDHKKNLQSSKQDKRKRNSLLPSIHSIHSQNKKRVKNKKRLEEDERDEDATSSQDHFEAAFASPLSSSASFWTIARCPSSCCISLLLILLTRFLSS